VERGGGFTIFQLNAWVETQDCASNFMSQTIRWTNITEEVRRLPSPLHDRVVAIMRGLDKRYGGLGTSRNPADTSTSRLTQWIDKNPGGHRVSIIGGTYAEEAGGPLRRVFAVLYDVDAGKPGWTNMRVELLGIDHEHPQHRESAQWKEANFLAWSRDLRRGLLALGATGEPCNLPANPPTARCRAYIPPRMHWEPMKAFHDFMLRELEQGVVGRLLDPPQVLDSNDWVDYEFVLDRL
jgi:hypothetical protein